MSLFRLQIIPFILFLIAGTNTFAQTTTPIKYGYLYNWYAVNDERKIAPDGWHVPSTIEINDMISYAGGVWDACRKLKCTGAEFWDYNQNSTNELGFNATGSGMRDPLGNFNDYHISSSFFSSDNSLDESYAYLFRIAGAGSSCGNSSTNISYRKSGQTVRLIKEFTSLSHGQSGTMVGNDGKTYRTICIGTQEWLADNLAETKYRNGDPIPNVTDNTIWAGLTNGARCAYNNNESNVLLQAIQITSQPSGVSVCSNINVTFSITATGAVNYLWRYTTDNGQTWTTVNSGSSLTSISFVATSDMIERKYQCVLTGEGSSTLNSEIVALTVGSVPSAPTLVQNVSVLEGSTAKFSAGVSDAGTYKWEVSTNNGNSWSILNSTTEASYTTDATTKSMNGYLYRCKLVNDCGESAPSASSTLTVIPQSEITPIKYGYLYNWYAVTDSRKVSSNDEWIIPNEERWNILTFYLGGILTAGGHLKDINPSFWDSPNVGASNNTGFNARGAGHRTFDGSYSRIKTGTAFHGELRNNFIYYFELSNDGEYAYFNGVDATYALANSKDGFSTRLVKVSTSLNNGQSGTYIGNDGKVYRTICIGTQEWLADNLSETKYRNGDPIPNVTDNTTWAALNTGALCAYNNDEGNVLIQNNPVITGSYSHIQNPTLCQNGKIEVTISNTGSVAYNAVPELEFSGITVQNVEYLHSDSYYSVNYTLNGNKITIPANWGDGTNGFADIDQDGLFDDLASGTTAKFLITYTLNNANATCSNSYNNSVSIIGKSTYTSQNNATPTTVEIFNWSATESGTASAVTPTAIASGHSQRFNFTPSIGQTGYPASSDNFNCTGLSVELAVPDGFVLASNSNPTYLPEGGSTPVNIGAVQNPTTKVITLTGGGSNGTYAVSLDLICDETQSSGTKDISWKLIRTQTIESNTVSANILCLNQTIQADFSCDGTIPQVYDDNLEIKTIVPAQTMNVCGDEAEYKILFKNLNSSATIDEINCTVNVPAGIRVNESSIQAIVVNGSTIPFQIINPNPLQIKLPLTNGLSFNQVVKVTFRASAGCDIIPVRQLGQSATELNVNNNISCSYNIYGSPVIFMHNGSSVVETNSYNIKYADLVMPISAEEQSIRSYTYQVLERKIPVINTAGAGSTNEIRVYVSRDAANLDLLETSIAAINENEVEITPFVPIVPSTTDPNNYVFTIDATVLTQLGLGSLLDGGEGFVIKEKVRVKSCTNTIATNYKAQWGCNDAICNADVVSSANASTSVYLVVEKGAATITSTLSPIVRPTFTNNNGSLLWTVNNSSVEGKNNIFSTFIQGSQNNITITSVKLSNDNGSTFTVNVPFTLSGGSFTLNLNFSADPDGTGGLSDIDNDKYYDDLPPSSSIKFLVEYTTNSCVQNLAGYQAYISGTLYYYDACLKMYSSNWITLQDREYSYTPSGNTITDFVRGAPFNFTFYPQVIVYSEQLKAIPDSREYFVELTVPNGVVLAQNSNPTCNSKAVTAVQVGNIITLSGTETASYGNYSVNLDLDCNGNTPNGLIDLKWKLKYKATYNDGSGTNTCTREIANLTKQTYAHFNCDNSSIITLNSSNGFNLQRNSFGWTRTGHTGNWYKSDLTDDKKVNKDTPNITLDRAMPYDEVIAYINGHIDLSTCNPDALHAKISYTSPNTNNYFDFSNAIFSVAGTDYTINSQQTDRYTITNTTGKDWVLDFILPESFVGNFTSSDISVKVFLKLKDFASPSSLTFTNLRGGLALKEGAVSLADESYGCTFSYYYPQTNAYFSTNQSYLYTQLAGYITSSFNNEFRPISHYENLWIEIPANREIDKVLLGSTQIDNSYYTVENNIVKFIPGKLPLPDNNYLYVFIYFKTNCASENITTTQNTGTYTLFDYTYYNSNSSGTGAIPPQTRSQNLGFYIYKPDLSLWLESNQPGTLNKAIWNTRVENKSPYYNSTYTWIAYEPDANNVGAINLIKVYNANGTAIPYDATGTSMAFPNYIRYGANNQNILVKLGNLGIQSIAEVRLEADYSNCVNGAVDKINVFAGWDPLSYPTSPATYPCNPTTGTLTLTHKTANLQWEINQVNEGPFNLCDVVNYQMVLNSTGLATMYDINASLNLPNEATLVSDITATYNGANYTIPRGDDPTYSWDLKNYIPALTDGFPSGKSIILNFQIKPECKFDPGSIIKFGASGITNCGVNIPYTYSTRIPINGVNIIDNFKVELNDINIYLRNAGGLVYVKVKNLGEITSRPQNVEVRLSSEFDYVVNSSSDLPNEPFSQTSLGDGTEVLLWKNFPNINPGDYFEFTFRILDHVDCPVNQGVVSASCYIDLNLLPTCPGSEVCTDRATLTSDIKTVKIPFIVPGRISQVIGSTSILKGSTTSFSCSKSTYSTGYVWSLTEGTGELDQVGQNVTVRLNPAFVGECQLSVHGVNNCTDGPNTTITINVLDVLPNTGSIMGNTEVCLNTSQRYTVAITPGATIYKWQLPVGAEVISYPNESTIELRFTESGTNIPLSVTASDPVAGDSPQPTTILVNVRALPDASFTGFNAEHRYCKSDEPITLNPATSGGKFTYSPVANAGDTQKFYPLIADIGFHSVEYSITIDGCTSNSTQTVEVTAPTVSFVNLADNYCHVNEEIDIISTPTEGGIYKYYIDGQQVGGNNENLKINPSLLSVGSHIVKFEFTSSSSGCSNFIEKTINIRPLPQVQISSNNPNGVCFGEEVRLTANVVNGSWPFTLNWNYEGGKKKFNYLEFNVEQNTAVGITVTDKYGCAATTSTNVVVLPKPNIIVENVLAVSCPTTSDGEIKFSVDYQNGAPGDILKYTIKPHNLGGSIKNIEITPNQSVQFTDFSIGFQNIKVESSNGCKDIESVNIENGGPVIDICPEAILCTYNNVDPAGIRVKVNVTSKRFQNLAGSNYSYTIEGRDVNYSGTGQYGEEYAHWTAPITVKPGKRYKFKLQQSGTTCNVAPVEFTARAASILLNIENGKSIYPKCDNDDKISIKVSASVTQGCMSTVNGDLNYRLQRKDANGNLSVVSGYNWAPAAADNSFYFTDLTLAGEYLVETKYKGNDGCSNPIWFKILDPQVLNIETSVKDASCFGMADGSCSVYVTGNTMPLEYKWYKTNDPDAAAMSNTATCYGLRAGSYSVDITVLNGCSNNKYTRTLVVGQPTQIAIPTISWLPADPCLPWAETSGGTASYTFNWYKLTEAGMLSEAIQNMFSGLGSFFGNTNTVFGTTKELVYSDYVDIPKSQPAKNTIKPGKYIIEVVDGNGCVSIMPQSYKYDPRPGDRTYDIAFRWSGYVTKVDSGKEIILDNLEATQAQQELEENMLACIKARLAELQATYKDYCKKPEKLNDKVTLTHTPVSGSFNMGYYTLYYYDRAGNLIRTVAPKDVVFYDDNNANIPVAHNVTTEYSYNSLGQLVYQKTPDANESRFIYNNKGQLRFSQNAEQANTENGNKERFSYTRYDELGRVIEVGECTLDQPMAYSYKLAGVDKSATVGSFNDLTAIANLDDNTFSSTDGIAEPDRFPVIANHYNQLSSRTVTVYSTPDPTVKYQRKGQRYLLNRVSYTYTVLQRANEYANGTNLKVRELRSSTYYSYDPHGNVEWVVQEQPGVGRSNIAYQYDLISNKVRKVLMNHKRPDAYYHQYEYDEDNRLLSTYTSENNRIWDRDANYLYFEHGPLKRVELGQDRIQGIDYAYTLQGWLKAINSPDLEEVVAGEDDGFAKDRFGMVLGYHEEDFYRTNSTRFTSADPLALKAMEVGAKRRNLYNGNISSWVSSYLNNNNIKDITGYQYKYDILNRIKGAQFNTFSTTFNPADQYGTSYSYDLNGNITNLTRNGNLAAEKVQMDNLTYNYEPNTNKLTSVTDAIDEVDRYTDDIDSQSPNNYRYDKIGNLVRDSLAGISIKWNVYGKVAEVVPDKNETKQKPHIIYTYDAAGNRVSKQVNKKPTYNTQGIITTEITDPEAVKNTYYLRDASGNTMAVYERSNRKVNETYEAVYTLGEVSLYGSDRLGTFTPDINSPLAILPFTTAADYYRVSLNLDEVLGRLPGTQTFIASSYSTSAQTTEDKTTFVAVKSQLNRAMYNEINNDYLLSENIAEFDGNLATHAAIGEDENGIPQFYIVPGSNMVFGSNNPLMVYNTAGALMSNTDNLNYLSGTKVQVSKVKGGEGKFYMIFTVGTDGKVYYHVVDMTLENGLGNIAVKNQPLLEETNHTDIPLAVEDPDQGKLFVFVSRSISEGNIEVWKVELNGLTETMELAKGPLAETELRLASYGIISMGINPDADRMLVYHHTTKPDITNDATAQLVVYPLALNLLPDGDALGTQTVGVTNSNSSATYTADGSTILLTINSKGKKQTVSFDMGNGTLTEVLTGTTGNLQLYADGRVYVSGADRGTISGINADLYNDFTMLVNKPLSGMLAQRTVQARVVTSEEQLMARSVGRKEYELKDHLGNVRALVADVKTATNVDGQTKFQTGLLAQYSYYPFGMLQPGRFNPANPVGEGGYRYGFNGKEREDDVAGLGATYDYGFRIYDTRIARFLSVDPLTESYPYYSPYQYAGNNSIKFIDIDGLERVDPSVEQFYKYSPKIDMSVAPAGSALNAAGYKRNGPWFWRNMLKNHPEMFDKANQIRIKKGSSPIVNDQWVQYNPSHGAYKGGKLVHHHIEQGGLAAGIPEKVHTDFFSELHPDLNSVKVKGMKIKGIAKGLSKSMNVLGPVADIAGILNGNPESFFHQFPCVGCDPENYIGKVRKEPQSGLYYTINSVENEYDGDRLVSKTLQYDVYESFIWDDDAGKYVGVNIISRETERWDYDKDGNRTEKKVEII